MSFGGILLRGLMLGIAVEAAPATTDDVQALRSRIRLLEADVEFLKKELASIRVGKTPATNEDWVERLVALRDHKQTAFQVGPELILLPPDDGWEIVSEAWQQIDTQKVKTGILKAYAFGKSFRPAKHPMVLRVLDLGMRDDDPEVQRYAGVYLMEYAKEDFGGADNRYEMWHHEYGAKSPEDVIRLNDARLPEPLKLKVEKIANAMRRGSMSEVQRLAGEIGETEHPYAIPTLIGVIDADNSYDTIYGVGYFGLWHITGVEYSEFHDGAWWKRWWAQNRHQFPEIAREQSVPVFPQTENGLKHKPFPEMP